MISTILSQLSTGSSLYESGSAVADTGYDVASSLFGGAARLSRSAAGWWGAGSARDRISQSQLASVEPRGGDMHRGWASAQPSTLIHRSCTLGTPPSSRANRCRPCRGIKTVLRGAAGLQPQLSGLT